MHGYNANVLHIQRSVSCTSGNTKSRRDKSKAWKNVVEDKLPKRKKQKLSRYEKTMNIELLTKSANKLDIDVIFCLLTLNW